MQHLPLEIYASQLPKHMLLHRQSRQMMDQELLFALMLSQHGRLLQFNG